MTRCLEMNPVKIKTTYINSPEKLQLADRQILTGKLIETLSNLQHWINTYNENPNIPHDVSMDLAYCERQDFDKKVKLLKLLEGWHA